MKFSHGLMILGICAAAGCTGEKRSIDPWPPAQPGPAVREAFSEVKVDAIRPDAGLNLSIKKIALDRDYLMTGSIIPQFGSPTSEGLVGRVIQFHHERDKKTVSLLEDPRGHVVTLDLPSERVLAVFPVVAEDDQTVTIDFNAGMNLIFTQSSWAGSDRSGKSYDADEAGEGLEVKASRIRSVEFKDRFLEIRQSAQVRLSRGAIPMIQDDQARFMPYEVRYYLAPYEPSEDFEPKKTSDFERVGYFETPTIIDPTRGEPMTFTTRWNLKRDDKGALTSERKIRFYVGADTPEDYVDAVKEGILYWNQAFGAEILEAALFGPDQKDVSAPDPRYNIVEWVDWDFAGSAYADGLSDPRTGELLHAQVYLTSVFAVKSKERARRLLRQLKTNKKASREVLRGLGSSRMCDLGFEEDFIKVLEGLATSEISDETLARVSKDYVRHVVAHEVGHTLGLRHNFASSLASNVTPTEADTLFSDYLNGKLPSEDRVFATSQMEYLNFAESTMLGSQMKSGLKDALSYDRSALAWGYAEGEERGMPLFCTDSHVGDFQDCQRSDRGAQPIVSLSVDLEKMLRLVPASFAEEFLAAKFEGEPLRKVRTSPDATAKGWKASVTQLLKWFDKDTRLLSIERRFDAPELFPKEIKGEGSAWITEQLASLPELESWIGKFVPIAVEQERGLRDRLGNVPLIGRWLGSTPAALETRDTLRKAWMEQLDAYLARADVRTIVDKNGNPATLTDDELELIRRRGAAYFTLLEKELLEIWLGALTAASLDQTAGATEIEGMLIRLANSIVLDASTEREGMYVNEPNMRLAAAKLLKKNLSVPSAVWARKARIELSKKLDENAAKYLGKPTKEIEVSDLSREKGVWWVNEQKVIGAL